MNCTSTDTNDQIARIALEGIYVRRKEKESKDLKEQ